MSSASTPVTWWDDDPRRCRAECAAMKETAPDLEWVAGDWAGWRGEVPLWPFTRPQPMGLVRLVDNRRFEVEIQCSPAHPMMAPSVLPRSITPPVEAFGWNAWHLLPSGALCLYRGAAWWDPATLAAALVPKISGWYIEYHLLMLGLLRRMPEPGIDQDGRFDDAIDLCARVLA